MDSYKITENFWWDEIACSCCGTIKIFPNFWKHMEALQKLRTAIGFPIIVDSGYRCEKHNKEIGGTAHSWHLLIATDVRPEPPNNGMIKAERKALTAGRLQEIYNRASEFGFTGRGLYDTFVHLDMRAEPMDWRG